MRDMMIFGFMLFFVFMCLRNGFVAYLLWGWAGLASINSYMYGFMLTFQFSLVFAVIALAQFLIRKDSERRPFEPNRTSALFMLFGVQVVLSATFAYDGYPRNWELATNMLKILLFCLLMPVLVTSRLRIHALLLVIAIATGYHGLIDGLKFVASEGGHMAQGIGKFGDNNYFAIVLIMAIPLLLYAYRYSANRVVQLGFIGVIPLVVLAVIATQSRGGWVSLMAVALWLILTSRRKFASLVGVVLCAVLVFQLAPEHWTARMDTIADAQSDSSFMGRLGAWQVSTAVALANPFLGGGFHSIEMGKIWNEFRDAPNLLGFISNINLDGLPGRGRAAHSIYFEVMGDLGFLGFFIYIAILGNALVTAREVIKTAKAAGPHLEWARYLAEMLTISVLAFAIGGAFLSLAYFELPYILFMLLEVLKMQVNAEVLAARNTDDFRQTSGVKMGNNFIVQ